MTEDKSTIGHKIERGGTCFGVPKMGFSIMSTPQHFSQGPMAMSSEKEKVREKAKDMPKAAYRGI